MDERRRVPRYLTEVSAELSHAPGEPGSKVIIEILSVQGSCVRGGALPDAGRKCQLSLEWQGEKIHAEAEVAWKSQQGLAGLKFLSLDQKSSENLRELLATLRMQPIGPTKVDH